MKLVAEQMKTYGEMSCKMSPSKLTCLTLIWMSLRKIRVLTQRGEGFHQDILDFESSYQGQFNERMMGDYIWGLICDIDLQYCRKSRKTTHF